MIVSSLFLTRFMELGITAYDGKIRFSGDLLKKSEFSTIPETFHYYDVFGEYKRIMLKKACLAFTLCQVPIIYHQADNPHIELILKDDSKFRIDSLELDEKKSASIHNRTGDIRQIDVYTSPLL